MVSFGYETRIIFLTWAKKSRPVLVKKPNIQITIPEALSHSLILAENNIFLRPLFPPYVRWRHEVSQVKNQEKREL